MAARYAVLIIIKGAVDHPDLVVPLGERITVGRADESDYALDDSRLSRVHLEVEHGPEETLVRDLQSRNGIFVNGQRCKERALAHGDRIAAGRQVLELQLVESPGEAVRPPDLARSTTEKLSLDLRFCDHCGGPISEAMITSGATKSRGELMLCGDCSSFLEPGSRSFRHFEVYEKLGAGSAGMVYRAIDRARDRGIALKILKRGPSLKDRHIERFLREADTIANLDHASIVKVFEAGEFEQGYYIALEYFSARDLKGLVKARGPCDAEFLTRVGIQIARALDHAGAQGVIHRDVKPANILYDEERSLAKLTDFGLAKQLQFSGRLRQITREGEGLGTPSYMPPEQMRNARNADQRSDIYSLGGTLYYLATGRIPIQATSYKEFVECVLRHDPPPMQGFNPAVPEALEPVVATCLRKRAGDRYQRGQELAEALNRVRVELGMAPI